MTKEIIEVYQGDLTKIKNVRPTFPSLPGVLDANWKCYVSVNDCDGNNVVADREVTNKVTDANSRERFVCAIHPSETESLEVATGEEYQDSDWVIQVENLSTTPPYSKEHHITLRVKPQGIQTQGGP